MDGTLPFAIKNLAHKNLGKIAENAVYQAVSWP